MILDVTPCDEVFNLTPQFPNTQTFPENNWWTDSSVYWNHQKDADFSVSRMVVRWCWPHTYKFPTVLNFTESMNGCYKSILAYHKLPWYAPQYSQIIPISSSHRWLNHVFSHHFWCFDLSGIPGISTIFKPRLQPPSAPCADLKQPLALQLEKFLRCRCADNTFQGQTW